MFPFYKQFQINKKLKILKIQPHIQKMMDESMKKSIDNKIQLFKQKQDASTSYINSSNLTRKYTSEEVAAQLLYQYHIGGYLCFISLAMSVYFYLYNKK